VCAEYLSKGSKVLVVGKVANRSYEDSNGVKKFISEVQARSVEFVGKGETKKDGGAPAGRGDKASAPDDDIPF
jgi:single-strand DNA-binding protein